MSKKNVNFSNKFYTPMHAKSKGDDQPNGSKVPTEGIMLPDKECAVKDQPIL